MAESNPPSATVYVRNLPERINITRLAEGLREIFSEFGNIVDIVAKKNIKARGQAFVVFETKEQAAEAIETIDGFDMFGRPMQMAFAKTRSDATVKKDDDEEAFEEHKKARIAEKERKQALEKATEAAKPAKRPASETIAERPAKSAKPVGQLPEDFLPPNKTLLLREFSEAYGKEELEAVFSRFPGFVEIRTVPGRTGLAFAQYEEEAGAVAAREAMNGVELGGKVIRITYQRA